MRQACSTGAHSWTRAAGKKKATVSLLRCPCLPAPDVRGNSCWADLAVCLLKLNFTRKGTEGLGEGAGA